MSTSRSSTPRRRARRSPFRQSLSPSRARTTLRTSPTSKSPRGRAAADVERDVTVVVKAFERPDCLRRLVASIRRFYPQIAILVVDDSASPLDPVPEGVTRYFHLPYDSAGHGGGRNFGLRHVETDYVLFCDDDMVFGRKTDLRKMLRALETTRFDVVSCSWMDHDPWTGVRLGANRFEGTLEIADGVLVHRYGATRGTIDGLPVFDVVHQFFMARRGRLGDDPWDPEVRFVEHAELFLSFKERGLLCTRLADVAVYHYPSRPVGYKEIHEAREPYVDAWFRKRGLERREFHGRQFRPVDRIVHVWPSSAAYQARRAARAGRRLVTEGRLRAGGAALLVAGLLVPGALGATITLGQGIGPWKLGQKYVKRPGLLKSVRHSGNVGPGCVAGPPTASRIDYYRTLRVSWRGPGAGKSPYLIDVATTRKGNRSGDGFVIGRSRLAAVRRAHPNGILSHPTATDRYRLSGSLVSVVRQVGSESWVSMLYWFDRRGVLIALETSTGGC
jgi:hypothetical protein